MGLNEEVGPEKSAFAGPISISALWFRFYGQRALLKLGSQLQNPAQRIHVFAPSLRPF
jgi:hypothetical protein